MLQSWTCAVSAAILLGALALESAAAAETCVALEPGPARTVTRVLDGETVALDDGSELRLVGALAPRAMDVDAEPGTWPMEAAASEALRTLVLGKSVELRFADESRDRYGRLQAQAFLIEGDARRWVQGALLERGLARAYATPGRQSCREDLLAAERPARTARVGQWGEAAYEVRSAENTAELLRYRATFQVVEGRVIRVGLTSGTVYLNFDRDWRHSFSASLRRDDASLLGGAYAANPRGLEGRNVRVRGWIEQRGGAPVIDLSSAGAVELVDDTPPQPERPR